MTEGGRHLTRPTLAWLTLLLPATLAQAAPHLDLSVSLNPASRLLNAEAVLSDVDGLSGFSLAPGFAIEALRIDGRSLPIEQIRQRGRVGYVLPRGTRRVELRYQGTLAPLRPLDHREVLSSATASADPDGSFLPGSAGWYPDPGRHFSYRARLTLPPGQKGLVPGNLVGVGLETTLKRAKG